MKKQTITITLILFAIILAACSTGGSTTETTTAPPSTDLPPPTPTLEPELADIALTIDAELTQDTCAGFDPIVGGNVTVTVTTEDGNLDGISKVEFYVEGELANTVTEPPYGFEEDTTIYDDGAQLALQVDVYDWAGALYQSESMVLRVDNTPEPTLKSLGEAAGLEMANIVEIDFSHNYDIPFYNVPYFDTYCQNFDRSIIGVGLMFVLQPQQGVWDFGWQDEFVKIAEDNDMPIRSQHLVDGVNLDWFDPETEEDMTPNWVREGDFSREEMIDIMYEHIETMLLHYGDQIDEWTVVNESFGGFNGEQGIVLKNNVWSQKLGDDYVELAFKYADQVAPDAVLILNEVNADYLGQGAPWSYRVDGFYSFVVDLLEKETPIDVVGFQFHWIVGEDNPTVKDIVDNFARYGELGLEVYITEMDVRIEEPVTAEELEEQARLYAIALQACLESEYCTSFAVWGHSDEYSWITWSFPGYGAATLFDGDMQPKPAYYALIEVLENHLAGE